MRRLAPLALFALSACTDVGPDPRAVSHGDLPPITTDYRTRILDWARHYYAEPRSLHGASISEPVLTRDSTGRILWLVCIEADATARGGVPLGPRRQAFGFAPGGYVSAPLDRHGATLSPADCEQARGWRSWPALDRL